MDQTNKCELCNKPFQTGPKARKKRFCTSRCRERAWAAANREVLNANVREYRKRRYKKDGYWRDYGPKAVALKGWMIELKSQPCHDCKGIFQAVGGTPATIARMERAGGMRAIACRPPRGGGGA